MFVAIVFGILLVTLVLIQIGKGYRPDMSNGGKIKPTGLLVATSTPKGAQVYVNGELKTATDDTISLDPGTYQVSIRKDGFIPWEKQIVVEKELVAQTNTTLFPIVPDLKSLTYTGAVNPSLAPNGTRILYAVPNPSDASVASASAQLTAETTESAEFQNSLEIADDKAGLWLLDLADLPLGFSRDPRQLVTGDPAIGEWSQAEFVWSPDSQDVLALFYPEVQADSEIDEATNAAVVKPSRVYRLSVSDTIAPGQLVNIVNQYALIMDEWNLEWETQATQQLNTLPKGLTELFATSAAELTFSPDETKIAYIATDSATLADAYIPPILAASTQTESRELVPGSLYVYDLKEDRNFLIHAGFLADEQLIAYQQEGITIESNGVNTHPLSSEAFSNGTATYEWFPTSRHLIKSEDNKVTVLEYDNTNHATIYSAATPIMDVLPHPSSQKLIVLTTLNPASAPLPNLYTLILE